MKDTDTICLAGGCFWGMEASLPPSAGGHRRCGGYANGDTAAHANYETVCTGITGFREAVLMHRGTRRQTCLEALLFAFFAVVDVELPNRQGPTSAPSTRPASTGPPRNRRGGPGRSRHGGGGGAGSPWS